MYITKFIKLVLDVLFPISCLGCQKDDTWLCADCFTKISLNQKQLCPLCHSETKGNACSNCRQKTSLDGLLIAADYNQVIIQEIIHTLKYKFIEDMAVCLGSLLSSFLKEFDKKYHLAILGSYSETILTVVPLNKKRFLERGFNQAELLAYQLNKDLHLNLQPHLLKRRRYTAPQATLKKKQRTENVKNSFCVLKDFNISGKNVIIIDDVATTLATLNECAKVLKQAGAQKVWGLVVARGG